jgi:hypothetical protein
MACKSKERKKVQEVKKTQEGKITERGKEKKDDKKTDGKRTENREEEKEETASSECLGFCTADVSQTTKLPVSSYNTNSVPQVILNCCVSAAVQTPKSSTLKTGSKFYIIYRAAVNSCI